MANWVYMFAVRDNKPKSVDTEEGTILLSGSCRVVLDSMSFRPEWTSLDTVVLDYMSFRPEWTSLDTVVLDYMSFRPEWTSLDTVAWTFLLDRA